MLISCFRHVFIRPGPLRVVLASIIGRFEAQKTKLNPFFCCRIGPVWAILGPVFLEVDYFLGSEGYKQVKPNPN